MWAVRQRQVPKVRSSSKKIQEMVDSEKIHLFSFSIYWHQNEKAAEPKWDKLSWRKNKNGHLWGFLWGHKPAWMAISAKVTLFYSIFPCFKGFSWAMFSFLLLRISTSKQMSSLQPGTFFLSFFLESSYHLQGVIELHDLDSCNHPESVGWSLLHICQYHWLHKLRYSIQTEKMLSDWVIWILLVNQIIFLGTVTQLESSTEPLDDVFFPSVNICEAIKIMFFFYCKTKPDTLCIFIFISVHK